VNYQEHHVDPRRADAAERLNDLSDATLLDYCEDELGELESRWLEQNQQHVINLLRETASLGLHYSAPAMSNWACVGEAAHRQMTKWAIEQLRMKYAAQVGAGNVPDWLLE
jgi:hypothetical protein